MSDFQDSPNRYTTGTPRWVGLAVAILGGVSLVSLGVGWSALNQAKTVEQSTQASVKQANEALTQRLARADDINQQLQSDVKVVTDKLNLTEGELTTARKQNKKATTAVDQKVTNLATSVKAELAAKANSEDLNKLNGDVSGVKTDLDATKSSIQMARSEMGTLIARNHDEIDQLRHMGQRDYFEFTVQRKGGATKVGAIRIELKDTNTKKNRSSSTLAEAARHWNWWLTRLPRRPPRATSAYPSPRERRRRAPRPPGSKRVPQKLIFNSRRVQQDREDSRESSLFC